MQNWAQPGTLTLPEIFAKIKEMLPSMPHDSADQNPVEVQKYTGAGLGLQQ